VTCREFADFIADYLSGELPVEVRQHFDHHLSICPNCQRYLSSYAESVKLGKRAFDDEVELLPRDVPEDLVQAILAARSKSST
jgi:anti-sigma factor RsiW